MHCNSSVSSCIETGMVVIKYPLLTSSETRGNAFFSPERVIINFPSNGITAFIIISESPELIEFLKRNEKSATSLYI